MRDSVLLGAVCFQEYDEGYLDFLELAAELDLSWVEFKYEYPLCYHKNSTIFKEIRDRADLLEIGLSMHTAFDGLNIASIDREERNRSVEKVKESIEAASEMEIRYATIHAGHLMSVDYTEKNWSDSRSYNLDSITDLINYASKCGIILCMENGNTYKKSSLKHGVHPGDMKYIRKHAGENLKYTVDFGHAMFLSQDPSFLVSELGTDLVKLSHLHSNSGLVDSHSPLGTGVLELEKLLTRSIDEKWAFPFSIEMKSERNLRNSLNVVREILSRQDRS